MTPPEKTSRETRLQHWVAAELQADDPAGLPLVMVSGDASFRRYFRAVQNQKTFIAVDAPPEHEDSAAFVKVCGMFRDAGVHAPEVYAVDCEQGFMLLEDLGDAMVLPEMLACQAGRDINKPDRIYRIAIDTLVRIQLCGNQEILGAYSRTELRREMDLFTEWFLLAFLELDLSAAEKDLIDQTMTVLEDAALAQPTVLVHRDYHSRNLMLLEQTPTAEGDNADVFELGVIDFQDAVHGPYSYDLVSLLRDCYIRWQPEQVASWGRYYLTAAQSQGLLSGLAEAAFFRDFDLMGLQRHLKVMGIFCRLYLRDNKSQYLADIPLVSKYFLEVSSRYPELGNFVEWFQRRVIPTAQEKLPKQQAL
ncbi:MAG: aminoglycoside phosphotransferase [Gammaproteobacteria bacterium]|nr:aminoglycoside phosphotransferase [Gammaproteobacteria bacterium]